ncbi:EamA family transporter [Candidatus Woesearchaeota archaeon]|nr:EamA family transporter [Candidatus Woesearchaeota archaeon]
MALWLYLTLGSALLFSISHFFQKQALIKEHSLEVITLRSLFFFALCLLLLPFVDFQIPASALFFMLMIAVIGTASLLCYTKAARHLDFSSVEPLSNLGTVFLVIFSALLLSERLSALQLFGVFLLIGSSYLLTWNHQHSFLSSLSHLIQSPKLHYLLFSLVLAALDAVLIRLFLLQYPDVPTFLFFFWLFVSFNYCLLISLFGKGIASIKHAYRKDKKDIISSALFGICSDALYYIAFSLPLTSVSLVGSLRQISTLFSTLFGGRFFHERGVSLKLIACVVMVAGVILVSL